jgi:hypothetical protein
VHLSRGTCILLSLNTLAGRRNEKTSTCLICIIHLRTFSNVNDTGVICMPLSALVRLSVGNAPAPDIIPDT